MNRSTALTLAIAACSLFALAPSTSHALQRFAPRLSRRISAPRPAAPLGLRWQLTSDPRSGRITMAQRARFRLWMIAHNTATSAVNTQRDSLRWYVNNVESMELQMAWSNGVRTTQWSALAPGATVREARDMGPSLFARPGTYAITIQQNAREVARLVVIVR